jgi:hypothetical protein
VVSSRALTASAVLCVCLGIARPEATVILPADFGTVVNESQLIVVGQIASVQGALTPDRRSIFSLVTVRVDEALKGSAGETVTFRVPNGQVGRYRRIVVGAPEFAAGDEVVLFLRAAPPAFPVLFGLSQGVYRIARGADGQRVVTPPPVMARGVGAERVVRGDPARTPLSVAAFSRAVREARGTP